MARLDDEEIRAVECLDRLKALLDGFGRKAGQPFFIARGKDEAGHHLRVTLLPEQVVAPGAPPATADGPAVDLADLIAEFRTLSEVVGSQHRQILAMIDLLAGMERDDPRYPDARSSISDALDRLRADTGQRRLRLVRDEPSGNGE